MALRGTLGRVFNLPTREKTVNRTPPGAPPHIDFIELIDNYLWEFYNAPEAKGHRKQGIFHPSQGLHFNTDACPREIVFDLLCCGRSRTAIQPTLARIFENGHNRQAGFDTIFSGVVSNQFAGVIAYEREILCEHPTLPISGRADARIFFYNGFSYVIDYKTINAKNFASRFDPKSTHTWQLNTYMGLLGERAGYVLYENKDNQALAGPAKRFRIDFDPVKYTETQEFCAYIMHTYVFGQCLPEFNEPTCKACVSMCSYKEVCEAQRADEQWFPDYRPDSVKKRHLLVVQ